jgi:hypothetical protein
MTDAGFPSSSAQADDPVFTYRVVITGLAAYAGNDDGSTHLFTRQTA